MSTPANDPLILAVGRFEKLFERKPKDEPRFSILGRLEEESALLRRIYEAECDKNPASRATESARNLIALKHGISQTYGESIAVDVMANALAFASACSDK